MLIAASGYVGWRKALPRIRYLEQISKNYSHLSGTQNVAQGWRLRRYQRSINGHELILQRLSSGLFLGLRFFELQAIFIPMLVTSPFLIFEEHRVWWYRLVVRLLRVAGPTFIKLGQWAATRPDVLPQEFCRELGGLHSRAPQHSMSWNRHMVRKNFSCELEEIFEEFSVEPIGSGSVAQVHRAKLKRNGADVAVKILHPNVEEMFEIDLMLMGLLANIAHRVPQLTWLHIPEEISYFAKAMKQQLDLRYEGYTLARFRRNFATNPLVEFPKPILASTGILVESFEDGISIGFFTSHQSDDPNWAKLKKEIALSGLNSFMQMLLWDNFVHADLHPGNMLVKFDGCRLPSSPEDACKAYANGHRPKIVFLDTGLVTELSSRDFANFTDLFKALVFHADGRLAGSMIIERSPGDSAMHVLDPGGFCEDLHRLVLPVFSHQTLLHLHSFSISPLLFRTFDLVREHHVRLEGAFTNLMMSLICVEGLGRELSPELGLRPILLSAGLQYLATNIAKTVTETVEPYL